MIAERSFKAADLAKIRQRPKKAKMDKITVATGKKRREVLQEILANVNPKLNVRELDELITPRKK